MLERGGSIPKPWRPVIGYLHELVATIYHSRFDCLRYWRLPADTCGFFGEGPVRKLIYPCGDLSFCPLLV